MCDSNLRRELVDDGLVFNAGELALPTRPGLGVELNRDALRKYAAAPLTL
jgi:L-alanine-DL-glutamate epimerase-like enolase superfamily enzyme